MTLHHFYHIYADGQCETPIREHIKALKDYGLYEALTTFQIGIVGQPYKRQEVINCLNTLEIKYTICAEADTGWEQVTMIPMWEFSKVNEGLILYSHSKGASDQSEVNTRWRRSMIYWNVIQWKYAITHLIDHDAYGCHWIQPMISMPEHTPGNFMFAGTFFWLRAEVMARFPRPALTHRHEAEGFVGYGWHEKPYNVYDPTPYFPNSGPFADGWVVNPEFKAEFYPPKSYIV